MKRKRIGVATLLIAAPFYAEADTVSEFEAVYQNQGTRLSAQPWDIRDVPVYPKTI